jgi:hypothetical protein
MLNDLKNKVGLEDVSQIFGYKTTKSSTIGINQDNLFKIK